MPSKAYIDAFNAYEQKRIEDMKGYVEALRKIQEHAKEGSYRFPADKISLPALNRLSNEGFSIMTYNNKGQASTRMSISLHDAAEVEIIWTTNPRELKGN